MPATTDRITNADLATRCANLSRRISSSGRVVTYQGRNGYTALDEYDAATGACLRTITVGTKREVAEFLHAMMVGIDLSRVATQDSTDPRRGSLFKPAMLAPR